MSKQPREATALSIEAASALSTRFDLNGIHLAALEARVVAAADWSSAATSPAWDLDRPVRVRWTWRDERAIRVVLPFDVSVVQRDRERPQQVARLSLILLADYTMKEGSDAPPSGEVDSFAGIVCFMHVWPYVRAEVQTLTAKLELPVLTLPALLSGQVLKLVDSAELRTDDLAPTPKGTKKSKAVKVPGRAKK